MNSQDDRVDANANPYDLQPLPPPPEPPPKLAKAPAKAADPVAPRPPVRLDGPAEIFPMPKPVTSVQPGGGRIMALELKWGVARRWLLRTFWPGYVRDMRARLVGDPALCPVEVIDDRDLKFHRNVAGVSVRPEDNLHAWRSRLPFARMGHAEMLAFAGTPLLVAWLLWRYLPAWWGFWLALPFAVVGAFVVSFFRDPHRLLPVDADVIASPADGRITDIVDTTHPDFGDLPVVRIGMFLSVFNVHVNRAPWAGQCYRLSYKRGKFLDARDPQASSANEAMDIGFAETAAPYRRFVVKQIAGKIASRIVCELRTGQTVARGERFGMIKFGSRTELYLAKAGTEILCHVGDRVAGGTTPLARFLPIPPIPPNGAAAK